MSFLPWIGCQTVVTYMCVLDRACVLVFTLILYVRYYIVFVCARVCNSRCDRVTVHLCSCKNLKCRFHDILFVMAITRAHLMVFFNSICRAFSKNKTKKHEIKEEFFSFFYSVYSFIFVLLLENPPQGRIKRVLLQAGCLWKTLD